MSNGDLLKEIQKRRTFAIISHPDAGKTTVTEKFLLWGNAIQLAGSVKGSKGDKHATSDWMKMEKDRGISITTSVMQFEYNNCVFNLLDTPGHADFSEDTYRTLTAVDAALMVIDATKGVEERTIKLMEVCRMRNTPIITLMNKLDRDIKDPMELLDEVEDILSIQCAPMCWPLSSGRSFKGTYDFEDDSIVVFHKGANHKRYESEKIKGIDSQKAQEYLSEDYETLVDEVEMMKTCRHAYDSSAFLSGKLTSVYFGTALANFGIDSILNAFASQAPAPLPRSTQVRVVSPEDKTFTGFVFKIQANMDPRHRDRIAFIRIVSGVYRHNMTMVLQRSKRTLKNVEAWTFLAEDRKRVEVAYPGDIIGIYNHASIHIGDTFTSGEALNFSGIPNFAPELFRSVRGKDPLKNKQLEKGLAQLSEEGAVQVFTPLRKNMLLVGAVGSLQFDVVAYRLKEEYKADCLYESTSIVTARWVYASDKSIITQFIAKHESELARDHDGSLVYLAPNRAKLTLVQEKWKEQGLVFNDTKERLVC